jgi:hypothetical protein
MTIHYGSFESSGGTGLHAGLPAPAVRCWICTGPPPLGRAYGITRPLGFDLVADLFPVGSIVTLCRVCAALVDVDEPDWPALIRRHPTAPGRPDTVLRYMAFAARALVEHGVLLEAAQIPNYVHTFA